MKVDVLTLFPGMFAGVMDESILRRAQEKRRLELTIRNLRDWTHDRHRTVDDEPYGGGPGMVLKPEPIFEAIEELAGETTQVVMLSPQGQPFRQSKARELAGHEHLLMLCGAYEGFDERVRSLVNHELSIGDYVLTNGALPAMVVIDAVTRLLPGVLGDDSSSVEESFSENLLEYPQYTRPADFRGMKVPEVLLSGDHGAVEEWRQEQAVERTAQRRPDLLKEIKEQLRAEPLRFKAGDIVKVHTAVKEGGKERTQVFQGIVLGIRGRGLNATFTVRRISYGEGVEKIFPVNSPNVQKVEVERAGKVRRAKLNYLRKRIGKRATLVPEDKGRTSEDVEPIR